MLTWQDRRPEAKGLLSNLSKDGVCRYVSLAVAPMEVEYRATIYLAPASVVI
jgi:hypothetical protein